MRIKLTEVIKKTNEDMINNVGKSIAVFFINWAVTAGFGIAAQILIVIGFIFFIFESIWGYMIGGLIIAIFGIIGFCISGILEYGLYVFYLKITKGEETKYGALFSGKDHIKKITLFQILKYMKIFMYFGILMAVVFIPSWLKGSDNTPNVFETLFTVFFSIFITIKIYLYNFGYYIIHNNPETGTFEIFRKLRGLLKGEILNILLLFSAFILIILLSVGTFWIGLIIGVPYTMVLFANYFNSLTEKMEKEYL